MSDTRHHVTLIIMFVIFITISGEEKNHDFKLTKVFKHQNEDIFLHCSLLNSHEEFNKNITVTWWYQQKTCNYCTKKSNDEEWKIVECDDDEACKITLKVDDTMHSGIYMCRAFPYNVDSNTVLQIELTKTFEVVDRPSSPELLFNDTQSKVEVAINNSNLPIVLQCRCRSINKVVQIKWFKQKISNGNEEDEENSLSSVMESPRAIKYFENFYEPVQSTGVKELDDNIFLSKLIISNITEDSIYVCVAINYFGFQYKEFSLKSQIKSENDDYEEVVDNEVINLEKPVSRSLELFLIPILLFIIVIIQISSILYLLIYRSIMKETNKNIV